MQQLHSVEPYLVPTQTHVDVDVDVGKYADVEADVGKHDKVFV